MTYLLIYFSRNYKPCILNENNIGLSVENLKLLDVNNDGKVSFIKSKMYVRFYQANSKKVA